MRLKLRRRLTFLSVDRLTVYRLTECQISAEGLKHDLFHLYKP